MSRRRSERRKLERAPDATVKEARRQRTPASSGALAAAGLLALICLVPFIVWGSNPYPANVIWYWSWGSVAIAVIVAVVAFGPSAIGGAVTRLRTVLERPAPVNIALVAAAVSVAMSVVIASYMFRRAPTTSDEVAQLWHARILLEGRWFLPPDPNPAFFSLENVIDSGRWYSQFPIGGPLIMTIGAALGAPWIVNPFLLGAAALGLFHFARRAFGETQGRAIVLLFSITPMVVFMAGTWMNHVSVLAFATGALAALVEWERAESTRRRFLFAAAVGACIGAIATIRPIDALVVAVVVGLFQLWVVRHHLNRLAELGVQGVAGAIAVAPLLYANAMTTGSPLRFGYDVMWGAGHNIGFHEDPYGDIHTLGRAVTYAVTYVSKLNISLEAWPVPALAIVILALVSMQRLTRWDALLLALFFVQVAVYASYSLVGELLGPRFLYTALPTLVVLIGRMPFLVGERFGTRWGRAAAAATLACIVIAWCVPSESSLNALTLVKHTRGVRTNMRVDAGDVVRDAAVTRAVVFVREPFGSRLLRRMWGVGVPRSTAARLLRSRDACSLLSAVAAVEGEMRGSPSGKTAAIVAGSAPFVDGPRNLRASDPNVLISSPETVTPECERELRDDTQLPTALFGPTLPLEPIDDEGRINGDVIYAADLGGRNEILRPRFGDRKWYRLGSTRTTDGTQRPELVPY